jgi:serine protease Do
MKVSQKYGKKYFVYLLFLLFEILGGQPLSFASPVVPSDLPDRVEKVLPGVMNISSTTVINYKVFGWDDFLQNWGIPQERKQTSLGSGFLMDSDGFIFTNHHVVEHADEVLVTLMDKRQFRAKIIGKDPKMDLALIQIRDKGGAPLSNLKPVSLGNSDFLRIGEPVFAVGNPFGLQHTVTMGIISAKNRTIGLGPFDNFLQTDASINPGNSGGPLFNLKSEVIGINTVIFSRTGQSGGLGFAIPINEAKTILNDLKLYGRVPRPWLGILSERITPGLEAHYALPLSKGAWVFNTVQNAPADRAGIKQGDIIFGINDAVIDEPQELERLLAKSKPRDKIQLKIKRGKRTLDLTVHLEEFPPRLDNVPKGIL